MRNNTRRNRNIGTAKQVYGQNNKMVIPLPLYKNDIRSYYERLGSYRKMTHIINGHEFIFIIEETSQNYEHACTVEDVAYLLQFVPIEDYGDMKYIIFRQPKKKEVKLGSVWGRLIYSFEFEGDYYPAIILESFLEGDKLIRKKKLSLDDRKEFIRLQKDGFDFVEERRFYWANLTKENVRNTQLYRTLLHEFGHYVHYLNIVKRPEKDDETFEEWERRTDFYHDSIPSSEKEVFAHSYADKLREKLMIEGVIPFDRKEE